MSKLPFCEEGEATLHSFQDDDLGFALGWKYKNESGIRTYNGQIIISEDPNLHGCPSSLGEIPSDSKLKEICGNYRNDFSSSEYARKRSIAYPPIGDQLDDLYKKGAFSDEMATKLKKVKDDFPKG